MTRHLELLAQAPDPLIRCMVANRVTKPKTINQLVSDSNEDVRWQLVYNRQLSSKHLIKLTADPSELVRISVASHTQTPPESLALLSQDLKRDVKRAVAKNPSTPESVLDVLAMSTDPVCREMVGCNPSTNLDTANQLLDDSYEFVSQSVESALLEREFKANPDWLELDAGKLKQQPMAIQKFLAGHPQTSPATLDILSRESSTEVQVRAAHHSQTPYAALEYLLSLNKDEVTGALSFNTKLTDSTEAHQEIYRHLEKWLMELQDLERLSPEARRKHESSPSKRSLCSRIARYNRNIHFLILCEQLGTPILLSLLAANRNIPETMLHQIFFKMGSRIGNHPSYECMRCMYYLSLNPHNSAKALNLLADVTANILARKEQKTLKADRRSVLPWHQISSIAAGLVINPSTPKTTKDMLTYQLLA